MARETSDASVALISHVFDRVLEIVRSPANADYRPYALEGCSAMIDAVKDRLPPGQAAIIQGALSRQQRAEGHNIGGLLEAALYDLDQHLALYPEDGSALAERARVASDLALFPGG